MIIRIIQFFKKKFLELKLFFLKKNFLVSGINLFSRRYLSVNSYLKKNSIPTYLKISLPNTLVHKKQICIKSGDFVLRGQLLIKGNYLTVPINASTSGYIKIEYSSDIFKKSSFIKIKNIIIYPDKKDSWKKLKLLTKYYAYSASTLINQIYKAGILGLGGSGFPSFLKLRLAIKYKVKTLVINGIESDPFISSDSILILKKIDEIFLGCKILMHILCIKKVIFAISENNIQCIQILKKAILKSSTFNLCILPSTYPLGSSKLLIKKIFGIEIKKGFRSFHFKIIVHNVGTIYAIKRSIINGEAFTERVVTVTGTSSLIKKGNIIVRIGTPIKHIVDTCCMANERIKNILINGTIMGLKINNSALSYCSVSTNCIAIFFGSKNNYKKIEKECIFCSKCSEVCPVNLLPQKLYWYIKEKNHAKTKEYHIDACIECKNCELVCPSNISLVKYYKKEKKIVQTKNKEKLFTKQLKIRFQQHTERKLIRKRNNNFFPTDKKNNKKMKYEFYKEKSLFKTKKDKRKYVQDAFLRVKLRKKI
ncbi:electron transport complex subunit RsxC [Buchnera aphidicola]|uniref:electron transport complex subunit RsxC n=1 Tax=Buchnera aphidicola TaxID=9 RepID=UPI0031B7010F